MDAASAPLLALSGIALAFTFALLHFYPRHRHDSFALSYPPGPKSPSMPSLDAWVQYQEWGREYGCLGPVADVNSRNTDTRYNILTGDLVYIREHNMLIINDVHAAIDLLDKRARIYSDRASTHSIQLCGADTLIPLQRYSDRWRRNRRLFQQNFRQSASSRFYPAQYMKIHQFLRRMTAVPEEFMQHTMSLSQGLIFASLYGIDFGSEDPLSRKAVELVELVGKAMLQPFPIIEQFPWLRFMPSWFPGFGFQEIANKCVQCIKEVDTIPFDKAVNNLKMGTSTSLIAELALESEGKPAEIEMIKAMGTISFIAGGDTTMSSISSFLLAMTQHPDVQSKARAEIDRVIGRDRLPTFEDRSSLPYVESIYREVMRMHPPVPLGLFHLSTEDDFYRGYHIPKGCTVVANIWAMNRDPNTYPEPDKFIPERFLDSPSGPFMHINSVNAFGFGRRVCAGRHMAENTVWLTIASVLATLDLRKTHDNEGNEVAIPGEFTRHFFRHPMPYRSSITPRDLQAQELISATDAVYSEFK